MGFSGGGYTAQMAALNAPTLVRRLILVATTPKHKDAFVPMFFTTSTRGQAAGLAAWERITTSRRNRCDYASVESAGEQGLACFSFKIQTAQMRGLITGFKNFKL
ncbi:hypothetical protein TGAM01_v210538 [Trichoderma gamsii]|uniref:AB hydrolase-1 domain-containing protein n=1 Tax=Trichoderma gamsii TaxID=398673 RepID=A0A2P4Z8H3_9HYPO|nr:hypothetical protein TGAM01_v210538 [Trichoderma gamsii]PON20580.1 hypothetical protein TGAM01_v210538 [Trichoderma gamsii]